MKFQILGVVALATVGCVASAVFGCSVADAQTWRPDRLDASGPGIKLGDKLEFHPGVALRGGYDTNVYKADDKTGPDSAGQKALGAGMLAVSPHFSVTSQGKVRATEGESAGAAPTPPSVALRLGAGATYNYSLTDKVPSNVDVDSDLWLGIMPSNPVNFALGGSFTRSTRPFGQAIAFAKSNAYAVDVIKPTATLGLGTASKVLTGQIGYSPNVRLFESRTYEWLSTFGHQVDAGIGWKFFPQTAIVSSLTYQTNSYLKDKPASAAVLLSDGSAFKTRVGLNGAVTTNFVFKALAGYAVGFYDSLKLQEFEDVIGEVSLGYRIARDHSVNFGYNRDIVPSPGGAWVRTDRINAGAAMKFADTFSLTLEAGYGYLTYGRVVAAVLADGVDANGRPTKIDTGNVIGLGRNDSTRRRDHRIDAAIRAQYDVTRWLALIADATFQTVITDFDYNVARTSGTDLADPAGYNAFQVYAGTRLHY